MIRRASEVIKVAETYRNLKGTHVKMLREAARSIVAGVTEMVRRMDLDLGAFVIMEGRIAALEAENEALRKKLTSRSTAEKSSETDAAIECKMGGARQLADPADGRTPPEY